MKNGENKTRLIQLIGKVIAENGDKALSLLKWNQIYFSKENCCFLIDEHGSSHEVEDLKSNQEEADTKVILHCLDALRTPESSVVLCSQQGILI